MVANHRELFESLRRGPWNDDPNGIPQEVGARNGNIESQGWLSDDSVTGDVIRTNAVIARHVSADAITAGKIAADVITAREIAADAVTASEIAANTITAAEIAANTITAAEIAANTITAAEIAADTITANEIAALTITAGELAADSVITSKILAGNVTSSRIELTISGKNFGSNNGTAGSPGIFFDSASNQGIYNSGLGTAFSVGGITRMTVSTDVLFSCEAEPTADDTFNLGTSSNRWSTVFRVAESAVSDERRKQDIADAPLGLRFVMALKPRVFRWRDTPDTQARESAQVDWDAMARECRPHESHIRRIRDDQRAGNLGDEEAERKVGELRDMLTEIRDRYLRPVDGARAKRRPGRRLHYGLIAQEVKAALDDAGVDSMDAAFWQQASGGEQSLSYSELMIPLLRAVQELAAQVESLTSSTRPRT